MMLLELVPGDPECQPIRVQVIEADLDADGRGTIRVPAPVSEAVKLKHKLLLARYPHAKIEVVDDRSLSGERKRADAGRRPERED